MSVFVIIAPAPSNPKLQAAINLHYPKNHCELYENQWLVSGAETVQEICKKLRIDTEPDNSGSAIVLSVASYWGVANPNVWEWLKVNWEKSGG